MNIYKLCMKLITMEVFTTVVLKWVHFDVHTNKIFSVWEVLSACIIKDYCEEWYEVLSTLRACVRAYVYYIYVWRQEMFAHFTGQTKILLFKHFLSKEKNSLLLSAPWAPTAAILESHNMQTYRILSLALSDVHNLFLCSQFAVQHLLRNQMQQCRQLANKFEDSG
jgi:hypothetical protein